MGIIDDLKDIVALSKESGISLSEATSLYREYKKASSDDKPAEDAKMDPEKTEKQEAGKERPGNAPQNEDDEAPQDNVIQYKKKIEELEGKISELQNENVNKDHSQDKQTKTDEDILNDITQSFM